VKRRASARCHRQHVQLAGTVGAEAPELADIAPVDGDGAVYRIVAA